MRLDHVPWTLGAPPLYIYRMLGGQYPLEEIVKAMLEIRRKRTEG